MTRSSSIARRWNSEIGSTSSKANRASEEAESTGTPEAHSRAAELHLIAATSQLHGRPGDAQDHKRKAAYHQEKAKGSAEPVAKRDPAAPAPTPKPPKVGSLPKPPKPPKPKATQAGVSVTSVTMKGESGVSKYRITTPSGEVHEGPVHGSGGLIRGSDGLNRLRMASENHPDNGGLYAPKPGHVKMYSEWTAHGSSHKAVPISGSKVEMITKSEPTAILAAARVDAEVERRLAEIEGAREGLSKAGWGKMTPDTPEKQAAYDAGDQAEEYGRIAHNMMADPRTLPDLATYQSAHQQAAQAARNAAAKHREAGDFVDAASRFEQAAAAHDRFGRPEHHAALQASAAIWQPEQRPKDPQATATKYRNAAAAWRKAGYEKTASGLEAEAHTIGRTPITKSESDHVKEFVLGLDLGGTRRWHSACVSKDDSNLGKAIKGKQADRTYSREGSRGVPGICTGCGGELQLDPAPREVDAPVHGEDHNEHKIEKGEKMKEDLSKGFTPSQKNAIQLSGMAQAFSNDAVKTNDRKAHEIAAGWHRKAAKAWGEDTDSGQHHAAKAIKHDEAAKSGSVAKSELLAGARHHYARVVRFQQLGKSEDATKSAAMCALYVERLGADPSKDVPAEVRNCGPVDLQKASFHLDREVRGLPAKTLPLIKAAEAGMPRHADGKIDKRYSIQQSYTGHASGKPQHVVYFNGMGKAGERVGQHETKEGAEALAREHASKRSKALGKALTGAPGDMAPGAAVDGGALQMAEKPGNYKGFRIENFVGHSARPATLAGLGRGEATGGFRKEKGFLIHLPDGGTKLVPTMRHARQYIDNYGSDVEKTEDAKHGAKEVCAECKQPISYHQHSRKWNHTNAMDSEKSHQNVRIRPEGWASAWHKSVEKSECAPAGSPLEKLNAMIKGAGGASLSKAREAAHLRR